MGKWNQILRRKEYNPEKPDEIVVNLSPILRERKAKRVLDLGCGGGRHVVYLAEQGFKPYAVDISETGLELTKGRLRTSELEAEIVKCDMRSIPFICSCFDAAICIRTIYHQTRKAIQETISEIQRVLKKNGLFLADFHSKRSSKYGNGRKVEEHTFIQENGPERGVLHHFVDEDELRELLGDFKTVDLEAKEKMIDRYLRSHLVVLAEKDSRAHQYSLLHSS